jgi:hypothetical protein
VVEQVRSGLYDCLFMEAGRCYVSGHNERVRAIEESVNLTFEEGDIEEALHNDIYQLNAYLAPGETDVLASACSNIKMTRWSPNFVDVFPRGGGKARAVRRVLEMYGISPEEAIAFGDGGKEGGQVVDRINLVAADDVGELGTIADVRHFGRTALEQFTLRLGAGNVTRDDGAAGDRFAKNHSQFRADLAGGTDHQNIFHLD